MEPNYYSIIPATVRYDENLSANAKLLYGEITALANQMGYCWASNNYFAKLYKVSVESIKRYLRQLKEYGYITVDVVRKKSNEVEERRIYINDTPSGQICTDPSGQKLPHPRVKNDPDNITSMNTTSKNKDIVSKVVSYLNLKTGQSYRTSAQGTQRHIKARINEGFTLEDFKTVIDSKNAEWGNSDMRRYLRPETLFGTKMESYLNAARIAAPRKMALDDEGWL